MIFKLPSRQHWISHTFTKSDKSWKAPIIAESLSVLCSSSNPILHMISNFKVKEKKKDQTVLKYRFSDANKISIFASINEMNSSCHENRTNQIFWQFFVSFSHVVLLQVNDIKTQSSYPLNNNLRFMNAMTLFSLICLNNIILSSVLCLH